MKKKIAAISSFIVLSIVFAFCVSGRFHQGFEYEHKSVSSLKEDENIQLNPNHIYTYDWFSEGIEYYTKHIDKLGEQSTDVFIVKAMDEIDIKGYVKQSAVIEKVIKGNADCGDKIGIMIHQYYYKSGETDYLGFYNLNIMQPGKEYIVFAYGYDVIEDWYMLGDGELNYACINDTICEIYNEDYTYSEYGEAEYFVDCDETAQIIVEIKDYLLNKYSDYIDDLE